MQVGRPIKIVKLPKYARESISIPITNIWCAHTKKPITAIHIIEYIIANPENTQRNPITSINVDIRPNTGNIIIYTSGCPKNQNRCWKSTRSPPPITSKKEVLKFLSNNTIVTPPAKIGNVNINKIDVSNNPQINNNHIIKLKYFFLHTNNVPTTFKEFKILETPNRCTENIVKSHAIVEWKS